MMEGSGAASLPLLRVPTIIGARVDVAIAIASCHDAQYMLELRGGRDRWARPRYAVKFVMSDDGRDASTSDAQYVLELRGGARGAGSSGAPARFTMAPSGGGIGCDRSHGRATSGKVDDADAIFDE